MAKSGLKISEIMDRKLVAVSMSTTIKAAAKLVQTSGVGMLPVLSDGKLMGVVLEEELFEYIMAHPGAEDQSKNVTLVMRKPVFAEADAPLETAIKKVADNNLTRLPIVDSVKNMQCVGIVSASELLKEASK